MATISFTRYHANDTDAVGRTNDYLVDGHGTEAPERTNRYIISPEKHGITPSDGYNCPNDPKAATEFMATLRANYERQHGHRKVVAGESERKDIIHLQGYLSWAEHEDVPADEAMVMTRELIEATPLRNYACYYAFHDNTYDPDNTISPGNKHVHLSIPPYSLDGTHKLCVTDRLRHDIMREADRISVAHGYSIVYNPVLLADPEYRRWFDDVVREGKTIIWNSTKKSDRRKYENKLRYHEAKDKDRDIAKQLEAEIDKKVISGNPEDYYAIPSVMDPMRPTMQLHVPKVDPATKEERSEIQCELAHHLLWAIRAENQVKQYDAAGKRVADKIDRAKQSAKSAYNLVTKLDIRTRTELQQHINDVGVDMAELRMDIKRQRTILDRMAPLLGQIEEWESKHTSEAYNALKRLKCASNEEIADAKLRAFRAQARLEKNEQLLQQRKTEYSQLCKVRTIADRCVSPESWQEYMQDLASVGAKTLKRQRESYENINYTIQGIGLILGLSNEEIDTNINFALTQPESAWDQVYSNIQELNRMKREIIEYNFKRRSEELELLWYYRRLRNRLVVIGPITFFLSAVIFFHAVKKEIELMDEMADTDFSVLAAKRFKSDMETIAKETISARKMLDEGMKSEDLQERIEAVKEYERSMAFVNLLIDNCYFTSSIAGYPYDIPRLDIDAQIQDARDHGEQYRKKNLQHKDLQHRKDRTD